MLRKLHPFYQLEQRSTSLIVVFIALTCVIPLCRASQSVSETLFTYNLTPILKYDRTTLEGRNNLWAEAHVVAALQGLANRFNPHLYIYYIGDDPNKPGGTDRFWLDKTRESGYLTHRILTPIATLEELAATFRSDYRGVVLYDLNVPATSNVASTVAGCDNLLPIPYDPRPGSVYDRLVLHGPQLPVKVWLINRDGTPRFTGTETGSAKCDAYMWAKRNYLDTGKCNPAMLAFYIDAWWLNDPTNGDPSCNTLTNHDYFIARKAFFFDLSPWDDEEPRDDPRQPLGTDYKTMLAILRSCYSGVGGSRMIHAGGFIPWAWKYTSEESVGGHHGGVATEWRYASILSCFNAYMDADALAPDGMANASVYCQFPLKAHYPQAKPTLADWQRAGYVDRTGKVANREYVAIYVGDYDSAAWMYRMLPKFWTDPARGSIPLGWAFDPNLSDRFAAGFAWTRKVATPNDYFICGDSGAGYLNPGYLEEPRPFSGLPSGLSIWSAHCRRYYTQWDISLSGFVIDGDARGLSAAGYVAYANFSPDGIVAQKAPTSISLVPGTQTPLIQPAGDVSGSVQNGASWIKGVLAGDQGAVPHFHVFRTVLWSPTQHQQLYNILKSDPNVAIVDPYTLMGLLKLHLQGH